MHPIERLRHVARAPGEAPALLAREAAGALAAFGDDPAGLVTACRRLVDRQPTAGPVWWLASRVLAAADPAQEAWRSARALADDGTPQALAAALPEDARVLVVGWPEQAGEALARRGDLAVLALDVAGEGHALVNRLRGAGVEAEAVDPAGAGAAAAASAIVLVEALAAGPSGAVAAAGSRAAAAAGRHAGASVWLVAGVGRVLPARLWEALRARLEGRGAPWAEPEEVVPADLLDGVVGPAGPVAAAAALAAADCPVAPELLARRR
jgi:hypothetical protein